MRARELTSIINCHLLQTVCVPIHTPHATPRHGGVRDYSLLNLNIHQILTKVTGLTPLCSHNKLTQLIPATVKPIHTAITLTDTPHPSPDTTLALAPLAPTQQSASTVPS